MKKNLVLLFLIIMPVFTQGATLINGIYYEFYTYNGENRARVTTNPNNYTGVIDIPETVIYEDITYIVRYISDDAFYMCSDLTSVTIPNNVVGIGKRAFYDCTNLTSITIPNSVVTISEEAFCECERLSMLIIPSSVKTIEKDAFRNCKGIESLTINDGVETIGSGAFAGLEKIVSLYIPKSVSSIDYSMGQPFYYSKSLETIIVDADNPNYDTRNGSNVIYEKSTNTLIAGCKNSSIPNGTEIIGKAAFYGVPFESITLPSSITTIGNSAFSNCENLKSITIPTGVTKIDEYTFLYCPSLESVSLPTGLKEIERGAFSTNSNYLKTIVIPEGVTTISAFAFEDCYALESVTLPSTMTSFFSSTFYNCNNITAVYAYMASPPYTFQDGLTNLSNTTLYVPAGSKAAYEAADYWKESKEIVGFGYIGKVDSELTGETDISCFMVYKPGMLENLYVQQGKPQKVKIIGEIDSNDLSALCHSGYDNYYPVYVDLSEAHINQGRAHYWSEGALSYVYRDFPDNYLDSDLMICLNDENDDANRYGPNTIVLPSSLSEFVGRANNIYYEQTKPFKTTIRSQSEWYYPGECKFHVPSGTRKNWIEMTTYPDNVIFIDGPIKVVNVRTAGELSSLLSNDEIESMNELTITGSINAKDFSVLKRMGNLCKLTIVATWEAYQGNDGPVEGQTSYRAAEIPAYTFQNHENLQSVRLVISSGKQGLLIGDYAFDGCTQLKSFECKGVSSLGDFCFRNTKVMGAMLLGTKYTEYGSEGDTYTEDNREFEHIGLQPFFGVKGSYYSYNYARYESEWSPDDYTYIYELDNFSVIPSYFYGSPYGRPYYSGVTNKNESILYSMTTTQGYNLTLPNSINTLADYAISGLQIESVNLGAVTTIGDGFLYKCPLLKSISCDNTSYKSIDGVLYTAGLKALVKYPCAKSAEELTIPSTVEQISKWAFEGTQSMTSIIIEATTPPALADLAFDDFDITNITLYVPVGCKSAYEAAQYWQDFGTIIEMETYIVGDANTDQRVDVADFVAVAHYLLERTPENFHMKAADANQDDNVDVADLTAIAHLRLYGTISKPTEESPAKRFVMGAEADTENYIYVDPISVDGESEITLSVKMKNAVEAEGFAFDLYLPEGMSFVTNNNGFVEASLSTERTTARKTNSFNAVIRQDGSLRVLAASSNGSSISGNDGEVALVTIRIDSSLTAGEYLLQLKNIAISDVNAVSHRTELLESIITILGRGITTGIDGIEDQNENAEWYTLDGRQLSGKPKTKGVYITNGKKVTVK